MSTPTLPAELDGLIERLDRYVAYFEAVETKPTPNEFYYAVKNDGEGSGWSYRATGFGPSDIREAAAALRSLKADREKWIRQAGSEFAKSCELADRALTSEKEVEAACLAYDKVAATKRELSYAAHVAIRAALEAAALAREANAEGGAVVYRARKHSTKWCEVSADEVETLKASGWEVQALHPSPQPSGQVEAVEDPRDIFLISALVEKPSSTGHRARVGCFASKEEAIGSSLEIWQVDGWSVRSYECVRCDGLFSALTASKPEQAVPSGWKLVPEQPTQAMLDAGYYPAVQSRGCKSVWQAMLSAAPASPTAGGGDAR